MKRSEMLKKMINFQHDESYYVLKNLSNEELLDFMDEILTNLEKAGMLPPARDADQKSSNGYARVWEWSKEYAETNDPLVDKDWRDRYGKYDE